MTNEKHLEEILHELHIKGLINVFAEKAQHLNFSEGREKYFQDIFKIYDEIISTQKN